MGPTPAFLIASATVAVLLVVAAYAWYNFVGWNHFTFSGRVPYLPGTPCDSAVSQDACPSDKECCPDGDVCVTYGPDVPGYCAKTCSATTDCSADQRCSAAPDGTSVCADIADEPYWAAGTESDVSRLRFKDCVFAVAAPDGTVSRRDVTNELNAMAKAYTDTPTAPPSTLRLDRPLNAFSFTIPGVNDKQSVPTADAAALWAGSACTLSGESRTI